MSKFQLHNNKANALTYIIDKCRIKLINTLTTKRNFMKKQNEKDLENYKKEVYNYLTQQFELSTETATELMKDYDKLLAGFWEDRLEVAVTATGMMHNF